MIKTQIQVPDELFQEIRAFAKQRQWSLAETFRRGAELLLQVYPEGLEKELETWVPPTSGEVGWMDLSAGEIGDAVFSDLDPHLP